MESYPPSSLPAPIVPGTLKLLCWVQGDDHDQAFPLNVVGSKTVGYLREAIKEKRPAFDLVSADALILWKVDIDMDKDLGGSIKRLELKDGVEGVEYLGPLTELSQVFRDLQEDHLHIVVQRPPITCLHIAQNIHATLWNKPLDPFICKSTVASAGTTVTFRYFTQALIDRLQLYRLRYREKVLLIRDEYTVAYESMQLLADRKQGGVIVTGQPGIGKTCFLFFVLFQRLSAGLPTALQMHRNRYFLFTSQGASVRSSESDAELPNGAWALSDSHESITQPCSAFLDSWDVLVVQACLPKEAQWRQWCKYRRPAIYVMDCTSADDLIAFGTLLDLDVDKLLLHLKTWGAPARVCIALERGSLNLEWLTVEVEVAARKLARNPMEMIDSAVALNSTDDSLLTNNIRTTHLTRYLLGFIVRALAALDIAHQSQFFHTMRSYPWLERASDWCFEKFVRVRLIAHPSSELLDATPAKRNSPNLLVPVCKTFIHLGALALLKKANKHSLPVYWRPNSTSFTSIDAIICTANEVILLQSTMSSKHLVKPQGLDDILDNLPLRFRKSRRLCLVFVTDEEDTAERLRKPKPSTLSSYPLEIYSSVFTVGHAPWSSREKKALENIVDKASIEAEILADPSYESAFGDMDDEHWPKDVKGKGKAVTRSPSSSKSNESSGDASKEQNTQTSGKRSAVVAVDETNVRSSRKRKGEHGEEEKGVGLVPKRSRVHTQGKPEPGRQVRRSNRVHQTPKT